VPRAPTLIGSSRIMLHNSASGVRRIDADDARNGGETNVGFLIRKEKAGLIIRVSSECSTRYFLDWIELDDPVGMIPIRRRAINASCPKDVFQAFPFIAINRHKTCNHPRAMSNKAEPTLDSGCRFFRFRSGRMLPLDQVRVLHRSPYSCSIKRT